MIALFQRVSLASVTLMTGALVVAPTVQAQMDSVKTVFVIVMSHEPWSRIQGNTSAPYINNYLLPLSSTADSYFSPPGGQNLESNYFWLEAGTNFGIALDAPPSVNHQSTTSHLTTLLTNAGISWKTYQEGIDGAKCPLADADQYQTKFNPFVYFDDVTSNLSATSPQCVQHVRPYKELATDLSNNTVPRYNFIRPNPCNAMHPSCVSVSDHIQQGDSWLAQEVPKILASSAYKSAGALFIIWDHTGDQTDGPLGLIVLSPFAKSSYHNQVRYTHGSTLRTFQEIFGVRPYLGDAANQTSMDDLFSLPTINSAAITLTWTGSPGATSYRVKRATTPRGPFATIATGILSTSYTDRGLMNGTTYFYVVTAVNGSGESPASAQISATPVFVPPAPTNLAAKQTP